MGNIIANAVKYLPRKLRSFFIGGVENRLARIEERVVWAERYAKAAAGCF